MQWGRTNGFGLFLTFELESRLETVRNEQRDFLRGWFGSWAVHCFLCFPIASAKGSILGPFYLWESKSRLKGIMLHKIHATAIAQREGCWQAPEQSYRVSMLFGGVRRQPQWHWCVIRGITSLGLLHKTKDTVWRQKQQKPGHDWEVDFFFPILASARVRRESWKNKFWMWLTLRFSRVLRLKSFTGIFIFYN